MFAFGDFELDRARFELRRSGQPVAVQPKVLSLLLVLVESRDRSVSDAELMSLVWPREKVSSASIKRAVMGARTALDDRGQSCIRTIRGHGYQFVRHVLEHGAAGSTPQPARADALIVESFSMRAEELIGRDGVLAEFDECLHQALAGRGNSLLIVGEPGMGKSRIMQELMARAVAKGARVAHGRCLEIEGAPPLWQVQQMLHDTLVGRSETERLAVFRPDEGDEAGGLATLADSLSDSSAPGSLAARFHAFNTIARRVAEAARERPIILLFDDLQKACQQTLRLLLFLARQLEHEHFLLVGTVQQSEHGDRDAHDRLDELAREGSTRTIALSGLSCTEIGRYLEVRTGAAVELPVLLRIQEQTAGNPLFIEEILRSLRIRNDFSPGAVCWQRLEQVGQSRELRGATERHLATLSDPCRDMLASASIMGNELSLGLLMHLVEQPADDVMTLLSEAIAAGVIQELPWGVGHYRFRHALLRDALYERCGPLTRARHHARLGLALEARGAAHGGDAELAQMAEHFRLGAPAVLDSKAVYYALRVAQRAMQRLTYDDAAAHFERALELADRGGLELEERLQLLLAYAEALLCGHEPCKARAPLLRAVALARELRATDALAQIVRMLGSEQVTTSDQVQDVIMREALAALPPRDEPSDDEHARRHVVLKLERQISSPQDSLDPASPGPALHEAI